MSFNQYQYRGTLPKIITPYLVHILPSELRDQFLKSLIIRLNTNGTEHLPDIGSRRRGVSADLEEQVCSEVTHLHLHKPTPLHTMAKNPLCSSMMLVFSLGDSHKSLRAHSANIRLSQTASYLLIRYGKTCWTKSLRIRLIVD
jgi:hypothetical protein